MGRITSITAACCAAALLSAAPAAAQNANRLTYVTFSGPVSLPGTTLPAGTYAFRLADSPADRHIVQVFNRDETKLFTTLLAVPAERNQAEGEPVITFKETPSDRPPAVRYWYYAGEKAGNEFVYPKNQAMMIARASGEGVMSVDTDSTSIEDWKKGTPTRVTATADPSQTSTASTASTASTTTSTATSTATTTAEPPTPAPATTPAPTTTGTGTSTATRRNRPRRSRLLQARPRRRPPPRPSPALHRRPLRRPWCRPRRQSRNPSARRDAPNRANCPAPRARCRPSASSDSWRSAARSSFALPADRWRKVYTAV
jgi:hypothetical protein